MSNPYRGNPFAHEVGGKNPNADPPFCHLKHDCDAGVSETATNTYTQFYLLNCAGPDSVQDLESDVRAHEIEICRVWFEIPDQSPLPTDGTFWLHFYGGSGNINDAQPLGNSQINYAQTSLVIDNTTSPATKTTADPGQNNALLHKTAVAIMPVGNISAGDQFMWKNDCHLKHQYVGDSRGLRKLHVVLTDSTGAIYTSLGTNRIFIEMFIYGELTK